MLVCPSLQTTVTSLAFLLAVIPFGITLSISIFCVILLYNESTNHANKEDETILIPSEDQAGAFTLPNRRLETSPTESNSLWIFYDCQVVRYSPTDRVIGVWVFQFPPDVAIGIHRSVLYQEDL